MRLVGKPVLIDALGFYQTRCGERVEIVTVSARHDFGCVGRYENGVVESWHKSGRILASQETRNDIVTKENA